MKKARSKMTEAQRLADDLEDSATFEMELSFLPAELRSAAAELRRLDAENARMRSELERPMSSEATVLVHDNTRLRAEVQALRGAVPAGWRLVPIEPTQEMLDAGRDTPLAGNDDVDAPEDYKAVYCAMLAAAQPTDEALRSAVPAGWKLVPIEPSDEMMDAWNGAPSFSSWEEAYKLMLAAAPQPAPGYRLCGFCGCHTNAKRRACCEAGKAADTAQGGAE
jgi:uncharacterized protein YbdZ (MbtH family)